MEMVLDWDVQQIQGQYRWVRRLWSLTTSFIHYKSQNRGVKYSFTLLILLAGPRGSDP